MDGAFVPIVVPGAAVDDLTSVLEALHLVGSTIDGSALGIEGAAVARAVGDEHEVLVAAHAGEVDGMPLPDLLAHLLARWPTATVGGAAAEAYELAWPVMRVDDARTVAVTPPADLMLSIFAKRSGVTMHEVRIDDHVLIGVQEGIDAPVDVLVAALVNAAGRSVVMWRTKTHTSLHVLKRGKHAAAHLWEPAWRSFGAPDLAELRDPGVIGDAAEIGKLWGLSPAAVVSLRALMRRGVPDLQLLADLMSIPRESIAVLEGATSVAELPGATAVESGTWRQELAKAMHGSKHDPAWVQRLEKGARELRPWYLVSSLVTLGLGVLLVRSWFQGEHVLWAVAGVVAGSSVVIDVATRWRRKRRR